MTEKEQTHFGYETINSEEKEGRVADVFDSVATKYDLMNDVMSAGIHRMWKNWYIWQTEVKPGEHVLDLAAGTGDITLRLAKRMRGKDGDIEGRLVSSDINASMLKIGEERLTNKGWLKNLEFVIANVEALPFPDNSFNLITMSFGLRNVTHQDKALSEIACSNRAAASSSSNSRVRRTPSSAASTTGTASPSCRKWANSSPVTATAISTSPNPSACTRRKKN